MFQGLFVGEFAMFQKYWWWTNQCGSLWERQSKTVDAPPIRWAIMSRLGLDFSIVWGVGEVRTWRYFRFRGFVLSLVPNNVQNGVPNVFSIWFSTCSPCFATYSMYCSYRPHFIPYSLPEVIIFLHCNTWANWQDWCHLSLWEVSKVLKFVFSDCHKSWKIFAWGINQWRLSRRTPKKNF